MGWAWIINEVKNRTEQNEHAWQVHIVHAIIRKHFYGNLNALNGIHYLYVDKIKCVPHPRGFFSFEADADTVAVGYARECILQLIFAE